MDRHAKETAAVQPQSINPQTRVGELLARWPESVEILVGAGLTPLADPGHRELVKDLPVTLEMACVNHGLDLDDLMRRLKAAAPSGAATSSRP
jgi:hypothetical protein